MSTYRMTVQPEMKWHKFLIYFSLWAGAAICVMNGTQLLTGSLYGTSQDAQRVYQVYSGIQSADSFFGMMHLAVAVYLIYARFQLAGYKKGAPDKLTTGYVLNIALTVGYLLVISNITKFSLQDLADSSTTSSIISSAVMILVNRSYYSKRKYLFCA